MKLESIKAIFTQEEDCCGRTGVDIAELTMETQDGGGGAYIVMTTDRFSIDNDDLKGIGEAQTLLLSLIGKEFK